MSEPSEHKENAMYTAKQVQRIVNMARLEGAPAGVEAIVADLKKHGHWPK